MLNICYIHKLSLSLSLDDCLYNTEQQLFKKVKNLCQRPYLAKHYRQRMSFNADIFQWSTLEAKYRSLLLLSKIESTMYV